ncbi:unnamed protein product [Cylicocyclus nassatus]|uniref:Receptor L-domain domain-containing protein n=1 Tax=Cylicocyclus nassatus TaxID=53992 RepID=A0AA36HB51_CYLNA|nr:unnamed protein product [Cylicocyclus nassatus]
MQSVLTQNSCSLMVPLYCILYVSLSETAETVTLSCTDRTNTTKKLKLSVNEKNTLIESCRYAITIELLDGLIFDADGLSNGNFNWLLSKELHMCVEAKHTDFSSISVRTKLIKGKCTGPLLRIINNDNLQFLLIEPKLLQSFEGNSEKSVTVRGNEKLEESNLELLRQFNGVVDLQENGECAMPKLLSDFTSIGSKCTSIYGDLRVDPTTPFIKISDTMKGRYKYEGCVMIEDSILEDVEFLEAFASFKPTPFCRQSIHNNRKLCVKNMRYIANVFVDIEVYRNRDECDGECIGGVVTDKFLRNNDGCRHVYGNLSIVGWRKKPNEVRVLRKIQTIEGTLIIENNDDLHNFTEFSNLRTIGKQTGSDVMISIKNNPDLLDLPLPSLSYASIWKPNPRIKLANNPRLRRNGKVTDLATERPVPGFQFQKDKQAPKKELRIVDAASDFLMRYKWYLIVGVVVTIVIILLVLLAVTSSRLRKKSKDLLPHPAYNLSRQSKEVLAVMCKDIVANTPMVWCILDRPLLWNSATKNDDSSVSSQLGTLKQHMISVAPNALVQAKKEVDYNRPLQQRVQMFFDYDYVLMIGNNNDITRIVPRLPNHIGSLSLYIDGRNDISVAFKLLAMVYLTPNIIHYKYEARNVRKKTQKIVNILFYQWVKKRLPTEFSELMQLLKFCSQRKVLCVSDRRKEVFSLMHLMFMQVMCVREPPNVAQTFQQHLRICNGAPLDQFEMLLVMRFILNWAQESSCIPSQLKERHTMWCHVYTQMSEFSDKHYNTMSIHPQHLSGDLAWLEEDVNAAYSSLTAICSFSEHPRTAMRDRYRMRTEEEKKREANLQAQTDPIYSEPRKENDYLQFSSSARNKKRYI